MQHLVQRRPPQVRIDNEHSLAALRENRCQIKYGCRFAFARACANHGDRVQLVIFARKQQVRSQDPVRLRMRALGALLDQQADVLRNHPQHRGLERALDVIDRFHTRVQVFDKEGQADAHDQPNDNSQRDIQRLVWLHRPQALHRSIDDLHHGGLGQPDIDLFSSDLDVQDLAEPLQLFQFPFLFEVRLGVFSLGNVGALGFFNFCFQTVQRGFG